MMASKSFRLAFGIKAGAKGALFAGRGTLARRVGMLLAVLRAQTTIE